MNGLSLLFQSAFIDNLALSYFLGMCTFLAVSRRIETAFGLGVAMFAVMAITVPVCQLVHCKILCSTLWSVVVKVVPDSVYLSRRTVMPFTSVFQSVATYSTFTPRSLANSVVTSISNPR